MKRSRTTVGSWIDNSRCFSSDRERRVCECKPRRTGACLEDAAARGDDRWMWGARVRVFADGQKLGLGAGDGPNDVRCMGTRRDRRARERRTVRDGVDVVNYTHTFCHHSRTREVGNRWAGFRCIYPTDDRRIAPAIRAMWTMWPSGLRRQVKVLVRKGVGSNPTVVMDETLFFSFFLRRCVPVVAVSVRGDVVRCRDDVV